MPGPVPPDAESTFSSDSSVTWGRLDRSGAFLFRVSQVCEKSGGEHGRAGTTRLGVVRKVRKDDGVRRGLRLSWVTGERSIAASMAGSFVMGVGGRGIVAQMRDDWLLTMTHMR